MCMLMLEFCWCSSLSFKSWERTDEITFCDCHWWWDCWSSCCSCTSWCLLSCMYYKELKKNNSQVTSYDKNQITLCCVPKICFLFLLYAICELHLWLHMGTQKKLKPPVHFYRCLWLSKVTCQLSCTPRLCGGTFGGLLCQSENWKP